MPHSLKRQTRLDAHVAAEMSAWKGQHNHGDGLTAKEHAKAHLAGLSPERRAELEREWL